MGLFNIPGLVRKYIGKILLNSAKSHGVSETDATLIIKNVNGEQCVWLYDGSKQVKQLSQDEILAYATSD